MALIIGSSALFVALIALWLVGENRRQASILNEAFLKAHINSLKAAIEELNSSSQKNGKVIDGLAARIGFLENALDAQKTARAESMETIAKLEKNLREKNSGDASSAPNQNQARMADGNRFQAAGKRGA